MTSVRARLGGLTGQLYAAIYDLTPRQRTAALRVLDGLTETNCAWHLYRLRAPLRGLIDEASSARELAQRRRARRNGGAS